MPSARRRAATRRPKSPGSSGSGRDARSDSGSLMPFPRGGDDRSWQGPSHPRRSQAKTTPNAFGKCGGDHAAGGVEVAERGHGADERVVEGGTGRAAGEMGLERATLCWIELVVEIARYLFPGLPAAERHAGIGRPPLRLL